MTRTGATRRTLLAASLAAIALSSGGAAAQTLRIGLQEDPDVLDPHRARTLVGRIVFTALCDKLIDTTPDLKYIPRLATDWTTGDDGKSLTMRLRAGVKFHDGEAFDAAAVKYNIERAKTLPDSLRKSELASVTSVTVVDPMTVTLNLARPDATLVAQLSDRAGMMMSPKAIEAAGAQFGQKPVCSGPYKFVERVTQDRIVLERFEDHWNRANVHIQRLVYLPIPDTTVRFANLRSGDLQMIERLAPSDVKAAQADRNFKIEKVIGLGYQSLYLNVANGDRAKTPVGMDKRVRQALSLATDRDAINQVVFDGAYAPANQPFPPSSPWYLKDRPIPQRDLAKAKALMKEAGVDKIKVEIGVANSPLVQQVTQLLQAMWAEIGVEVVVRATEFATLLKETQQGNFQVSQYGWSGRTDPDGNIHQFVTCKGSLNEPKYCNETVDNLLNEARTLSDTAARKALYDKAQAILLDELPVIYTYHEAWIFAMAAKVTGYVPHPDGMIRIEGMKVAG